MFKEKFLKMIRIESDYDTDEGSRVAVLTFKGKIIDPGTKLCDGLGQKTLVNGCLFLLKFGIFLVIMAQSLNKNNLIRHSKVI